MQFLYPPREVSVSAYRTEPISTLSVKTKCEFTYSVVRFSGVGHPAVKRLVDNTVRTVGPAVINQSADNAQTPVGITLFEEERIGCKIAVQFDFTWERRMPLPLSELFQTLLKCLVADAFGILHYLIVVLLTHDFHGC